jgi:hypothetical protein
MDEMRGQTSAGLRLSKSRDPEDERSLPGGGKTPADKSGTPAEGKYIAVSPNGKEIAIPKELFTALSDFIEARKYPGSIIIQFRNGEIICVEAVAKKTYRGT